MDLSMSRTISNKQLRGKLNLTIHPEIRAYAEELSTLRRRSISQLFEDLVDAEWMRLQAMRSPQYMAPQQPQPAAPQSYRQPYPPQYPPQ
jgi:hypothetical protein